MVITRYRVKGPKLIIGLVADLRGCPTDELYRALENETPDIIACPGDLCTVGEC